MSRIVSVPNLDDLIRDYESGVSLKELFNRTGISRSVLKDRFIKHGVHIRNRSEGMYTRMAQTSPEGRAAITQAAHNAARGRKRSIKEASLMAQGRQRARPGSLTETILADMLRQDGFAITQQLAVGPYNLDIAFDELPLAVEVFGGNWHTSIHHKTRHLERCEYLRNLGWTVVIIWVDTRNHPLTSDVAKRIIPIAQRLSDNPPPRGEYWMFTGNGKDTTRCKTYLSDRAMIETPCNSRKTRSRYDLTG